MRIHKNGRASQLRPGDVTWHIVWCYPNNRGHKKPGYFADYAGFATRDDAHTFAVTDHFDRRFVAHNARGRRYCFAIYKCTWKAGAFAPPKLSGFDYVGGFIGPRFPH